MRLWIGRQIIKAGHLISAVGCFVRQYHSLEGQYCRFCGRWTGEAK